MNIREKIDSLSSAGEGRVRVRSEISEAENLGSRASHLPARARAAAAGALRARSEQRHRLGRLHLGRLEALDLLALDLFAQRSLDLAQRHTLLRCYQTYCLALAAHPRRAPDAMDVALG